MQDQTGVRLVHSLPYPVGKDEGHESQYDQQCSDFQRRGSVNLDRPQFSEIYLNGQ